MRLLDDDNTADGSGFDPEAGRLDIFMKRVFGADGATGEEASPTQSTSPTPSSGPDAISPDMRDFDDPADELTFLTAGARVGHYEIKSYIGHGGFGVVYRAVDLKDDSEVALKLPRPDRVANPQVLKRFYREARLTGGLEHSSIVRFMASGVENGTFYIASEFQYGQNLRQWVKAHNGPVATKLVVSWGIELADALQHAFLNGVVHRDLKPTNILIQELRDETGEIVTVTPKITDFGLAYSMHEPVSSTSGSGVMIGTPSYMAPEQVLSGLNRVDIRADIYALGLILAELIGGRPLRKFEHMMDLIVHLTKNDPARDLDDVKTRVPVDLHCILLKAVEVEPERRYQTPGELRDDLKRFQSGKPTVARPMNRRERWVKYAVMNPYPVAMAVVSIVFCVYFLVNRYTQQAALGEKNSQLAVANSALKQSKIELEASNLNLGQTNETLNGTNERLRTTLEQLRGTEKSLVRQVYNSSMRLAYSEFRDGHVESAQDILDRTRRMKSQTGEALPEFSWRYLSKMASDQHSGHKVAEFDTYLPGPIGLELRRIYEANRAFIDKNSFLLGEMDINDDVAVFYGVNNQLQIDGSFRAKYSDLSSATRLKYHENGVEESIALNTTIVPTTHLRLSTPPDQAEWTLKLNNRGELVSEFAKRVHFIDAINCQIPFNGSQCMPVSSLNGQFVFGVVTFEINQTTHHVWVGYDFNSREAVDLGPQVNPTKLEKWFVAKPGLSQSGKKLAYYDAEKNEVNLYDVGLKTWRKLIDWSKFAAEATPVYLAPDENRDRIYIGDTSGRIRAWRFGEAEPFAEYPARLMSLNDVGILPSGLIAGRKTYQDRVWIWNPDEIPQNDVKLDLKDEVWSLVFDRSGRQLVGCGDDNRVHIWDIATGNERILENHDSLVTCGRFSSDGSLFAACDYSGWVKFWKTSDWNLVRAEKIGNYRFRSLAWAPDNSAIIVAGNDNAIFVPLRGEPQTIINSITKHCDDVVYSAVNKCFILSIEGIPSELVFYSWPDLRREKSIHVLKFTTHMSLSPDEKQLAVGYVEGGFGVYDIQSGQSVMQVENEQSNGEVRSLTYLQDGRNLISAGGDNRLTIYETETWEPIGTIMDHGKRVQTMAVSADGSHFASGDMEGRIIVRKINP